MFDGDVNYTLNIGSEQGALFNFAYIVDTSASMGGTPLAEAKAAYRNLTDFLIGNGIAKNSEFAVVPFNDSASLSQFVPPDGANHAKVAINSLSSEGSKNFNSALVEAQNFFNSQLPQEINIAYFISDGSNNESDFSSIQLF